MKKRFLVMAVCVSACMPVSALGAEIAGPAISGTAQENTDNKEETVSEEAIEKKDSGKIEDEITEVQDTVTVAADTDVLDYPGRKEGLLMISGAGFYLRMIMEKNRWDISQPLFWRSMKIRIR